MEHLLCTLRGAEHTASIISYFNPHTKVGREVLQPSLVRWETQDSGAVRNVLKATEPAGVEPGLKSTLLPMYLSSHNFPWGSESPEGLVTPRRAGSQHPVSGSGYLGQSLGICIITSSQVTLMLLGRDPTSEPLLYPTLPPVTHQLTCSSCYRRDETSCAKHDCRTLPSRCTELLSWDLLS